MGQSHHCDTLALITVRTACGEVEYNPCIVLALYQASKHHFKPSEGRCQSPVTYHLLIAAEDSNMKAFIALLVLSCALAGVRARQLKQTRSAAEVLASDSRLSTLNAAVKVCYGRCRYIVALQARPAPDACESADGAR